MRRVQSVLLPLVIGKQILACAVGVIATPILIRVVEDGRRDTGCCRDFGRVIGKWISFVDLGDVVSGLAGTAPSGRLLSRNKGCTDINLYRNWRVAAAIFGRACGICCGDFVRTRLVRHGRWCISHGEFLRTETGNRTSRPTVPNATEINNREIANASRRKGALADVRLEISGNTRPKSGEEAVGKWT
jgi:hypothetical protein